MSNKTDTLARNVHGMDPQSLIDTSLRHKIYRCNYWLTKCFGLDPLSLIDNATALQFVGTTYTQHSAPTEFVCLLLKLLQIQPHKDIIVHYLKQGTFKYLRVLAAFYVRLVFPAQEIYALLEPILADFRKIRLMTPSSECSIIHIDEIIDYLLHPNSYTDGSVIGSLTVLTMPQLAKRWQLENNKDLDDRKSYLVYKNTLLTTESIKNVDTMVWNVVNPYIKKSSDQEYDEKPLDGLDTENEGTENEGNNEQNIVEDDELFKELRNGNNNKYIDGHYINNPLYVLNDGFVKYPDSYRYRNPKNDTELIRLEQEWYEQYGGEYFGK